MHENSMSTMIKNNSTIKNGTAKFFLLEEAISEVEERIDKALRFSPPIIREYTAHLAQSKGKLIRARALLICAGTAEGLIPEDAVILAASVELLHLATLVHDDVMDEADLRRNQPTLNHKYGRKTAVICGDYLFCLCMTQASKIEVDEKDIDFSLAKIISRICFGELLQHINNGNLGITSFDYLKIISGKTAALFEGSFYAGAYLSRLYTKAELKKFRKLGRYLGMVFQISDDCIDFEMEESEAGKPVRSDYEQGVVTLPLIFALSNKPSLLSKLQAGLLNPRALCQEVSHADGVKKAKLVSLKYYEKAMKLIEFLSAQGLDKQKRQALTLLFDKALKANKDKG